MSTLPVMGAKCKTCPFRLNAEGLFTEMETVIKVIGRTLFKGQQICHGTETGKERTPHNRCRGSYDYNIAIYKRVGFDFEAYENEHKKKLAGGGDTTTDATPTERQ